VPDTPELALVVVMGLLIVVARVSAWRACRTPIGRVNYELAQQRARRRR
jgi:hypothetical protein